MQSQILSNPIYKHSGESEKQSVYAVQASVNEDQELRRRLLDKNGEKQKKGVANEVAHMVSEFGGNVHLKQTLVEPKESILAQAQHVASDATKAVSDATASAVSSAASTATSIKQTTTSAAGSIFNTLVGTVSSVASTAAAIGHDAASLVSNAAKDANAAVHYVAHEAQHKATDYAQLAQHKATDYAQLAQHKATDYAYLAQNKATDIAHKAVDAAGAVKEKTVELAHEASNKAYELADNISHFAALVSVLAEEENERARRLVSGDESRAAANAFRVSALIRELDPSFYKQTPNLHYGTKILEEAERRWRLNSNTSQLAESNAHKEGKLVAKDLSSRTLHSFMPRYQWVRAHINAVEEKERVRRLNDSDEAWAMINSFALASLIKQLDICFYRQEGTFSKTHAAYATTLLEENERRSRIRLEKFHHTSDNSHHLMDIVSHNIEKFQDTTRHAARFATEFANLVGTATLKAADQFSTLTKNLAETATDRVKTAAKDISNFSNLMYIIALEEKERARRIADPSEQIAIHNAWVQSHLIRELSGLYRPTSIARYPLSLIEEPERAWRMANIQSSASKKIAALVLANLAKFQEISLRAAEREHVKDAAAHSRLNPNAPSFVPHQALPVKVEPAFVQPTYKASGAQL